MIVGATAKSLPPLASKGAVRGSRNLSATRISLLSRMTIVCRAASTPWLTAAPKPSFRARGRQRAQGWAVPIHADVPSRLPSSTMMASPPAGWAASAARTEGRLRSRSARPFQDGMTMDTGRLTSGGLFPPEGPGPAR